MPEILSVNGKEYEILSLLGKGKGGYSYLAEREGRKYVLKQIHHEPCDYYTFGNKMEAEIRDYEKLRKIGIRIPKLYEADMKEERILKEYIEGETISELIRSHRMEDSFLLQIKEFCALLYPENTNIDYYPTNFIPMDRKLYYIDYECNDYSEEWNFENWGIKYWSETPEFIAAFGKD